VDPPLRRLIEHHTFMQRLTYTSLSLTTVQYFSPALLPLFHAEVLGCVATT
jgi:hypothetical protein